MMDDTENANGKLLSPDEIKPYLDINPTTGRTTTSMRNFTLILQLDSNFADICFDELRAAPARRISTGNTVLWSDTDDAAARAHVELNYGIRSPGKMADAFRIVASSRRMNPVAEIVEAAKWDGVPRVNQFLTKWMKAPDSDYSQECSRLLFAQGIRRIYEPGCKADTVVVLLGPQGCGKSTLARWLALRDDFYSSVKTIAGQRGYEAIRGKFVCEFEELLAIIANRRTDQREDEAKAFISTGTDHYRQPYDHFAADYPRRCIFIGTSNSEQFLTDPTGNRRWFPIRCGLKKNEGFKLYAAEEECKREIQLCWAEMRQAYLNDDPLAKPTPNINLWEAIEREQQAAEVEDPRIGMIQQYCKDIRRDRVCLIEIWRDCLHSGRPTVPEFDPAARRELGNLLRCKMGFTQPKGATWDFPVYGHQKYYRIPDEIFDPPDTG